MLAISLNHAAPDMDGYSVQLSDFQTRDSCLKANCDYFRQKYVYGPFFKPRATMLGAYAEAKGLEVPKDWCVTNEQYSLYLERYPTTSQKCKQSNAPHSRLEAEVFVMALNRLAHKVVLGLLRPRAVLLAGKATWPLLRSSNPVDVSQRIRREQKIKCPVTPRPHRAQSGRGPLSGGSLQFPPNGIRSKPKRRA